MPRLPIPDAPCLAIATAVVSPAPSRAQSLAYSSKSNDGRESQREFISSTRSRRPRCIPITRLAQKTTLPSSSVLFIFIYEIEM